MSDVMLTLKEAADILRLSYERTRVLAVEGKIPALRVGGTWRVNERKLREMCDCVNSNSN